MGVRKVLFFVGDFAGGGTQNYLLRVLRGLERARFEPTVACFVPSGPLYAPASAVARIVVFPLRGHLFDFHGLRQLLRYRRMLRIERFDVVHTLSDRANVFGLIGAASARQRHLVASQRALDPVSDSFTQAGPALVALSRFLFRRVADQVTVNNPVIAEHLERVVRVPRERILIIENGIDTTRFHPRPGDRHLAHELGLTEGRQVVGIVARLAPRKGHGPLLQALERLPPVDRPLLVIAGDGPMRGELTADVRRRGLEEWVRHVGFVEDPARLYNLLDAFCLPTTFAEGTPTALIEALSSGVPCIVSDLPQLRAVVEHGTTGLLVDPSRPEEIAAALRRLATEPDLPERLRQSGRALAMERYGLETMIRKTQSVYEELLKARDI